MNPLLKGLKPAHPGAILRRDILPALGQPKTEIAALLGVSRQMLYDILDETKPVTPAMAMRLGKLFGNGPELWINLQRQYDLHALAIEMADDLKKIPTLSKDRQRQ
jgi:addiction module HigA family antidote